MAKYAGYESGYREPSLAVLRQLSELFGTSIDELAGDAEPDAPIIDQTPDDPELGLWFKELAEAPDERRRELQQIWEIIKQREIGRKREDNQE